MPSITVDYERNISFHYTDSGPIKNAAYSTLVIVHGHSFHSGVFQRLTSHAASSRTTRIICVNRRGYPGSTPYTANELKVLHHGSDDERLAFLQEEGFLLGLFIDGLITTHSLPKQGGVSIAGWSMGSIYTLALRSALVYFPHHIRLRLKAYLKSFIIWDAPAQALGIDTPPDTYVPLLDESIPAETRGPAFVKWCASYFKHGNLASKDFSVFNQRYPDPKRKSTVETMSHAELSSAVDPAPGHLFETLLIEPGFAPVIKTLTNTALCDFKVCQEWSGAKMWAIYGDNNGWNVVYPIWILEETMGRPSAMRFKAMKGANHFMMWEVPKQAMKILTQCVKS